MNVQINDAPKSQKEICIELPYESFESACGVECEKIAAKAKIPGFRPGKAPKNIVSKQYTHQIRANAIESIINNAVKDVLSENSVNSISQPDVRDLVLEDNKPISFKIYVDVYPQFNVEKFKDFNFDRTVIKVEDKDVEDTIERIKNDMAEFKPLVKKRAVKKGDKVVIDFEGKLDGVAFDGGTAEKYELEIGSGSFIPGFEDQVIGMKIDETKDLEVKFPENYQQADLAGKDVVFTVVLHEIKEKIVPELNDEFASKVNAKAGNVDELKAMIKKDLQYESDQYVKFTTFTEMLNKLVEENTFEVPESIINEQAGRLAQQNLYQYYQMGINPEMFGLTVDSMRAQFTEEAERQVKRALIIGRLAEQEKIDVADADIDSEVAKLADISGKDIEDIKKEVMGKNFAGFKNDVLADKVYNFLCGINTIKDRTVTRSEFEKESKEKAEAKNAEAAKDSAEKAKGGKKKSAKTEGE